MYVYGNPKTKKALRDRVKAGDVVRVYDAGISSGERGRNGEVSVEGPQYPKPHSWYARVRIVDGIIVKVLS